MLLGGRFNEFDKPYFTQIEDFVVFSDNPNTLKGIIDHFMVGEVLTASEEFREFDTKFDSESTVFVYSNIPILYDNLYGLADASTKLKMAKNKDFIICFPHVGLQLTPEDDLFESRLVINYKDVETVKRNMGLTSGNQQSNPQTAVTTSDEITDAIFNLKPIYPNDLNAKSFSELYANGATKFEVDLKDGLKHGRYTEYYPNGNERITGRFRNDIQVGTWRYFDEEGKLVHKKRF